MGEQTGYVVGGKTVYATLAEAKAAASAIYTVTGVVVAVVEAAT